MLRVFTCVPLAFVVLISAAGCGGGVQTAKMTKVHGTVNLDGQPMPDGEINFFLPALPPTKLEIKNGVDEGKAGAGASRVEIRAYKAGTPIMMGTESFEGPKANYLPTRYNSESTLTAQVDAGGTNEFKFDVTSQ